MVLIHIAFQNWVTWVFLCYLYYSFSTDKPEIKKKKKKYHVPLNTGIGQPLIRTIILPPTVYMWLEDGYRVIQKAWVIQKADRTYMVMIFGLWVQDEHSSLWIHCSEKALKLWFNTQHRCFCVKTYMDAFTSWWGA